MPPTIADLDRPRPRRLRRARRHRGARRGRVQYVTDLGTVWRARLRAVAAARGTEPAPPGADDAVDALVEEAGRITDPHRAIDWLSTLPQVALAALGEPA